MVSIKDRIVDVEMSFEEIIKNYLRYRDLGYDARLILDTTNIPLLQIMEEVHGKEAMEEIEKEMEADINS